MKPRSAALWQVLQATVICSKVSVNLGKILCFHGFGDSIRRQLRSGRSGRGQIRIELRSLPEARIEPAELIRREGPVPELCGVPDFGVPELHNGHDVAKAEDVA